MIQTTKTICVAAALCMGSAALAQSSGWSISEADGQVSVIRGDKSLYGARGTELQVGDVVKTSGAANAVLVRGDKFVVVEPDKAVRIKPPQDQGMVGQMVEFVSGLLAPSEDKTRLRRPMQASVVKGLGGNMMAEQNTASESGSNPSDGG
ncbi:hypothetical protein INR77_02405 [Erythrobacter sp. SCSIO 43205]|uniref:hypothetical protein n=1 Tax=Erythrobacter sp. SCSIO 43205 TaxID=2779361 RepID=UPI001CA9FB69|nr:hypothetical protein [Erythrobacter sp. SCSIO 43205]UAB78609.1 hypothetical protein INR77_02405 [Erythrobacter sp. SCSIO 43205]